MSRAQHLLSMTLALSLLTVICYGVPTVPDSPEIVVSVVQVPDSPDGTMEVVFQNLADGKPVILWHTLPASYQKDVNDLIREFADKVDAEMYDKIFAVLNKAGQMLGKQKAFFLASPMFADAPAEQKEKLAKNWNHIVGVFRTLGGSDINTVKGLKGVDVQRFLNSTGATMMRHGFALAQMGGENPAAVLRGIKVELISIDGDSAVVKTTDPEGVEQEVPLVRVEGKWLAKETADDWKQSVASTKAQIAQITARESKVAIMGMLTAVETVLDQLDAAKTQEEFDAALMQAQGQIIGIMMMMGGMGGR